MKKNINMEEFKLDMQIYFVEIDIKEVEITINMLDSNSFLTSFQRAEVNNDKKRLAEAKEYLKKIKEEWMKITGREWSMISL